MKIINTLLILSAIFFISTILITQCTPDEPETETEPEIEINYVTKAMTANMFYLKDSEYDLKIPFLSDESGVIFSYEYIAQIHPGAKENYCYVLLTGGYFEIDKIKYYYESLVGVEIGNKSATYGISGIDIVYCEVLQ